MQKNPRNLRPRAAFARKIQRYFDPSQGHPLGCFGMGLLPDRKNTEFSVLILAAILWLGSSCSDSPDSEKTKRDGCITSIRVYPPPEEHLAPGAVTVSFTIKDKTLEHQLPNLDKKISIVNKTLNNLGVHRLMLFDYYKETHQFKVNQPNSGYLF